MDLTPVKIRGKRGLGQSSKAPPASGTCSIQGTRYTPSKRKMLTSDASNTKRRRKEKIDRSRLSALERLPNELLQYIFLLCENTELPGCSLLLARSLSNQHVQIQFVLKYLYHPRKSELLPTYRISHLLTRRFFDWPFFQAYLRTAYDMAKRRVGVDPDDAIWDSDLVITSEDVIRINIPSTYIQWITLCQHWTRHNDFAESQPTWIPRKLLHGPWTEEKASFLWALVQLRAEVNYEHSSDGEIAVSGVYSAIRENNVRAVLALIQQDSYLARNTPQDTFATTVPPLQITTSMLRHAVLTCDANPAIVWHLLHDGYYNVEDTKSLDQMDDDLWTWAQQDEESGGTSGPFLKAELRHSIAEEDYYRNPSRGMSDTNYPWRQPSDSESRRKLTLDLQKIAPDVINPFNSAYDGD